jgi:hypothetical protein
MLQEITSLLPIRSILLHVEPSMYVLKLEKYSINSLPKLLEILTSSRY